MDCNNLISLIPLLSSFFSYVRKKWKKYSIEDLNNPDKKEEAASFFSIKGKEYIDNLISNYNSFIDPEFVQRNVFSEMKIGNRFYRIILEHLRNQYDWYVRYVTLIIVTNARIDENDGIMKEVEHMSRHDNERINRIEAYNFLYEKLGEGSLDHLLWGIENDDQVHVKMNCIDKIIRIGKNNQNITDALMKTLERERDNRDIIEKLIEAYGELRIRESFNKLIEFLDNDNRILSAKAAIALLKICDDNALDPIKKKCLGICDISYRRMIIEEFEHKKGSSKAINILKEYVKEHPDEEGIVFSVLAKLYESGGGSHG